MENELFKITVRDSNHGLNRSNVSYHTDLDLYWTFYSSSFQSDSASMTRPMSPSSVASIFGSQMIKKKKVLDSRHIYDLGQ